MKTSNLLGITRADLEAEIGNNWCLFYSGEDVSQVEIRCIDPVAGVAIPKMFYKDDYDDLECFHRAIESYAIDMNLSGSNAYICMNPIRTDFAGTRANDKAIQYRDLLLIDIDRAGTHKVPSTDAELQASLDMGDSVAEWLSSKGFPAPIKTCSGNGCHLYYPLHDLENTDPDRDSVKSLLTILGEQFNTPDIEIDPSVSNASRITKFLGTIMRKGTETPDRPYRMARMVVMNGQVHQKTTRAMIQRIVDEYQAIPQVHEIQLNNSENKISLPPGHSELISQLDGFGHLLSRPMSPEEADHKRFVEALKLFSPDDRRGNGTITGQGEDYLGVVFAGASIGAHDVVKEWAMRSDKFEEAEFESSYRSWGKTDNPVTVRSLYYHLSNRQSNASSTPRGPLEKLRDMSATGSSREMRNKMLTDVFVMKGICIQGQWTVIYAPPNSGKTLIVIWLLFEQVKAGLIQGRNVFYVNADDTYKGGVEKTELAEPYDVKMLIPAWRGFDIGQVTSLMQQLAETGQALGIVIVLDTLKKFTDLMDKRAASEFGKIARAFVSAGGTLIALAHTNKHKDSEGKGIYSGTSDIVDDCDCAFMIDKIDNSQQGAKGVHTVEFTNKKARGDVESTVAFRFERCSGQTYEDLLESIERISGDTLDSARKHAELVKQLEDDDEVIHALSTVINSTNLNKVELIKSVNTDYGFSHKRIRQVLKRHTGNNYCDGARWKEMRAQNNRVTYELVDPLKAV